MRTSETAVALSRVRLTRLVRGCAVLTLISGLTGCGLSDVSQPSRRVGPKRVTGPILVAAGDIACPRGERVTAVKCRMAETAKLAENLKPRAVVTLGDQQYDSPSSRGYRVYDHTWGSLKSITRPVLGDHGKRNYYTYFENQLPRQHPNYYAYNLGTWRVYALDSSCTGSACDPQVQWLERDMTANPRKCTLLTMHRPRYSSGRKAGGTAEVNPFWVVGLRHHADVALAGHEHNYERFDRMNANDELDPAGMRSFVVGTGGKNLYGFVQPTIGSTVRVDREFGVLTLTLGTNSYAWRYETMDEGTLDAGTSYCV